MTGPANLAAGLITLTASFVWQVKYCLCFSFCTKLFLLIYLCSFPLWSRLPSSVGVVRFGPASVWPGHRSFGLDGVLLYIRLSAVYHVVPPLSGPEPARPCRHVQQRPAGGSDPDPALVLHLPVDQTAEGPEGADRLRSPPRSLFARVRRLSAPPGSEEVFM